MMVSKKKMKKKKSHLPIRLNILFFFVFVLFSVLILRLGYVQIVTGEEYREEVDKTVEVTVNNPVPRGRMLDRNHQVIVDNQPVDAITYTRYQGTKTKEIMDVAEKIAGIIVKDTEKDLKKVTVRDKKDYWIYKNPERAKEKITEEEIALNKQNKLKNSELYKRQVDRVTGKELNEISNEELEVIAIYKEMANAQSLVPKIIKNEGVTEEEIAVISENLESLHGIDVTTDWNRMYLFENTLKTILGNVTSANEGIPAEKKDYYLARDYGLNDRIGKSYLEYEYEDLLSGEKEKVKNITDKAGNVIESVQLTEGQRGKDLVLTIDMELQIAVEKILEEELLEKKSARGRQLLDRAFVVLLDPNNGEVLTLAGKQYSFDEELNKNTFKDFALGTFTTSYEVGSSIKGATVLMGYETGAITPNQPIHDTTLNIGGGIKFGSVRSMGSIDDIEALKRSSNVYMAQIALRVGGGVLRNGKLSNFGIETYDKMRYYYDQFGLGVRTGLDLPNESTGMPGVNSENTGLALYLSIGQYDTYTPLQLAQYASTIANGGSRMKTHLVKEIREPSDDPNELGAVVKQVSPVVLNTLNAKPEWIDRVQEGFRQVMQVSRGTAYNKFRDASYSPAGKTGTAQANYAGPLKKKGDAPISTTNSTLVAYAPHNNPEVAMAVVVPWAYQSEGARHYMSQDIGRKVLDTYFELKKNRLNSEKLPEAGTDESNPIVGETTALETEETPTEEVIE